MSKLVVLNLGKGNLKQGFPSVTAALWEDGNPIAMQFTGSLPAAPELWSLYKRWQLLYQLLYEALYPGSDWRNYTDDLEDIDIEIDEEDVTNVSSIDFSNLCDDLHKQINSWLKSEPFRHIDQKLRTKLNPDDEIRLILATEDNQVRRLPWHLWNFFEDYQKAIACSSILEVEQVKPLRNNPGRKIRILAVLGNSQGIDVQQDRAILEQLPGAEIIFLVEPQRQELDRWLWDKRGWDMLFFAGHGSTDAEGESGRIHLNQTDTLTIAQLKNALKAAIARGLNLVVFNSCEGLELARELGSLQIPQMIVMREPVPDFVAQEFLKHFLEAFAHGESFYLAVREAQDKLQGLENEFPCASWLPVICQNPAAEPLVWPEQRVSDRRPILPSRRILPLLLKVSLVITTLAIGIRSLGILQLGELAAFDLLMRSRPPEKTDPRILVVEVTEADVSAQPATERAGASLSDKALAEAMKKIERFNPRVIGLDIYRENPTKPEYANLAKTMQTSDRFIAICKASEDKTNPGVPPPPEVSSQIQRQGFSDVVADPDNVIRRQILAMSGAPPCATDKSFSFRLASLYLKNQGIQPQLLIPENNWQFGNVVFKTIEQNIGGYSGIDNLGYQVLLNWRAANPVAQTVTLKEVLDNQLTADLVRDRIVMIGTTAESFHDYWSTPYSSQMWPHKQMPGVVVQAHMVSQILSAVLDHRPLLWVLPKWGENLWIWVWCVAGGVLAWQLRSRLRLIIALIGAIGILYLACLFLLIQGLWIPLLPSALVLLTGGATVATLTSSQSEE
ncbi:CHASE2 domain-containing protein [Pelatocladus sp. BLCC-F211]|uniref:CHASE2 domain-containing protein n=1 Tax=Pelatocladus sp. BLCC-F211 TaxID=3342752 RepID=UPI0035BAE499